MNKNATPADSKRSYRSTDSSLIASDRVEGTKVLDRSGKHIGTINGLKIDKVSGRVAYAVVEFGGFLGMGGHEYTLPWGKLAYDPSQHGFSTDLTEGTTRGCADQKPARYLPRKRGRCRDRPAPRCGHGEKRNARRRLGSRPGARVVRLLRCGLLLGRIARDYGTASRVR